MTRRALNKKNILGTLLLLIIITVWPNGLSEKNIIMILQKVLWILIGAALLFMFIFLFIKIRNHRLLKTVTSSSRGTRSERDLVLKLLKHGISAENIFHDLYVEKQNGEFSQIDLVVLTSVGVMVFEVKDFSGWIYGSGNHSQWTKVLAYGKSKYPFYNPIMQNSKHIQELKKQNSQFSNLPFYSIVVFYGNCLLKDVNFIPKGTYLAKPRRVLDVMKTIEKVSEPIYYKNKSDIIEVLKKSVLNGENMSAQKQHIENINDMLGKDRIFD